MSTDRGSGAETPSGEPASSAGAEPITDGEPPGEAGTTEAEVDAEQPAAVGRSEEFDLRGWTLLGVIAVCFLVIPAAIVVRPPGLPWEVAFLVLPLVPAALLGATAVWAALGRDR